MDKTIDFEKSVYDLCKDDPNLINILIELGFDHIAREGMLNTVGRFMTLSKGATMKGISLDAIEGVFINNGYTILRKE